MVNLKNILLPLTLLSNLRANIGISPWNIVKIGFGRNNANHKITVNGGGNNEPILKVFYPNGSYTPSASKFGAPVGGIGFYACPQDVFPTEHITLNYQVYFDDSFQPVHGGKLPGLYIGQGVTKFDFNGASGAKHNGDASFRLAWKPTDNGNNNTFGAEAYVYLPTRAQHVNYFNLPGLVQNPQFGDSLWRGQFLFSKYKWNNISISIKLNSFRKLSPRYDGELTLSINNQTQSIRQLIWRTTPSYQITALLFSTFFGGSTPIYATPHDTYISFKNIHFSRPN